MKKQLLLAILVLSSQFISAQSANDTASNPYYLAMMQDKSVNFFQTVRAFNLYWQGRDSSMKGCGWKAFKRWEWNMRQIINVDGSYPDMQQWINNYYKAASPGGLSSNISKGGMQTSAVSCKTKGDWKELGPGFQPYNRTSQPGGVGRINAVAFHPTDSNTLWICAPAGGLWKSTNGGQTWTSNTDSMPTMGTSSLVISSRNTDTMYLGTGDRDAGDATGLGVYMSTNAGKTWTARNSGMGTITIARLIIHPTNTKILLAATASGIYRTTNSGGSWSQIVSGNFKDIVFNPGNPNTIYATKDGLFYKSTNGGTSFTNITSGLPTSGIARGAIAVTPADTGYVYFLVCDGTKYYGTYRSTNGGVSFSTRSTTPNVMDYNANGSGTGGQAWYDLDVACDPSNKDVFYVGGVNIFKSTDGAATWTISAHWIGSSTLPSIHADQHNLEIHPITKKLYATNDGGIFYTPNSGAKWIDLSNGIGISQIYKLGKSATNKDLMIAGFQDNGTSYFTGTDWNSIRGGDGMDCVWDRSNEDYSYGALYYGNITRFYKGVQDITVANNSVGGINETGDWVTPYCLRPDNTNTMFVGYKNIWRNTAIKSGTMSWTNITNNGSGSNIRCVESSPAKSDIVYYSRYDNKLFRSYKANSTASWVDLTSSLPASGTPSAIACHPTDSNMVFIGLNGRLYQSRNRGVTWTDISSGLPINRLNCIALDTSNSKFGIYVGTYTGVWFKDSTTTFSTFSSGLPINGSVTDLEIFYDTRHKSFHRLWGSTYARGTWKTSLYDGSNNKPKTEFSMKLPKNCSDKLYTFTPECGYNPGSFKWYITPNTYTYLNGTDSLSEILKVKFNKSGYYTVRLVTENCNGVDTLTKQNFVSVFDSIPVAANCKTTTTDLTTNYGIGILNFEMNGTANPSSGAYDEGSNVDFSCTKSFLLKPNTKYFTKVTTGAYYNEYVKIYIDYNNNGAFTDAGELVYNTYNKSNHADTIRCPGGMVKNKMLRMRVLSDYNSISAGCGTLSYGQSEDYGVFFDEPTPGFKTSKDSICVNTAVTVSDATLGYGYNYVWSFGSGASPSTGTGKGPFSVKYTSSGIKKITLTINGSLTKTKDSAVYVLLTPSTSVFVKKGSLSQCEKDTITLAARDSKKYAILFQWQKNNSNVGGFTIADSLLKLWNNTTSVSGNYRVISSNGVCRDTSANVAVSINPYPKGGFTVNNLNQCLKGNKFVITDTTKLSSGSYKTLYTYSNSTTDTNKIHNKVFTSANTYTVKQKVTTNKGCSDSATKTLIVFPKANLSFNINDSDQCKNGNSFTFTNTSTISSGTITSTWLYGNSNTSTGTNGSQSYASNGNYNVSLTTNSNNNCKDTLTRKIIVFASPVAKYTYNDSDQCIRNNKFVFTNTSTIASGTNSYLWFFGDNTTSTSTSPSKTYGSLNTFNAKLRVTSDKNCTDSVTKTMVTYPNTTVGFNVNDTDQCKNGNSFTFTNTSTLSAGTFTNNWLYGNSNSSSGTNGSQAYASSGNYSVSLITTTNNACKDTLTKKIIVFASPVPGFTINDSDQCIRGNRFSFTNTTSIASGTSTYQWSFGDNTTSVSTNPSKSYSSISTFTVKLIATSNNNCKDSIVHQTYTFPNASVGFTINDTLQCRKGNLFSFTNTSSISSGSISSFWLYGDSYFSSGTNGLHTYAAANTYGVSLITTSNNNCKDTLKKVILVLPTPTAGFNVNDSDQCLRGNKFIFTNTSTGSAGTISYFWQFGDPSFAVSTNPGKTYTRYDNFDVWLKASYSNGCTDSIMKKVIVFPMPVAKFTVNDSSQCLPINNFSFTSQSSIPQGSYNLLWNFGDGNTGTTASTTHTYAGFANYTVKLMASSTLGCNDTFSKSLEVYNKPVAAFNASPAVQCLKGNVLSVTNTTNSAKTYTTLFDMGNSTTQSSNGFKYSYTAYGTYKLSLKVTVKAGCEDTISKTITILESPVSIFVPNTSQQCLKNNLFTFKNHSTPSGSISTTWKYGDGNTSTNLQDDHRYNTFGTYTVQLISVHTNTCSDTLSKTLTVDEVPVAKFTINDSSQCLGINKFVFSNTSSISSGTLSSNWSFGDANSALITSPSHQYAAAGKYSVRLISSSAKCSDTTTRKVIVFANPSAAFKINNVTTSLNKKFSALNKKYVSYSWKFSDGFNGTDTVVQHTFVSGTGFNTQLVVTDSNGCTDTSKQTFNASTGLNNVSLLHNKTSVYPNPSSSDVSITFELAAEGFIHYTVFDVNGKRIADIRKDHLAAGTYTFPFHFEKSDLAAGTYFFELETSEGKMVNKVVYTR